MKHRARRLRKLVALAALEERVERTEMGRSQHALEQAVGRLDELNAYRATYGALSRPGQRMHAARWHDYRMFLARLDEAIRAQGEIVAGTRSGAERCRRNWHEKRKRLESLEQLLERYVSYDAARDERLEQGALDELAAGGRSFDS
jgi:flagellar protein FliJ